MPLPVPTEISRKALLAEDDAMVRELVATFLKDLGYQVVEVENGQQAIDYLDTDSADLDLIVTDLIMPKANGAEVIRSAKIDGKCDSILIISGFTQDLKFVEESVRDGSEFLTKPFTFDAFESRIQRLNARKIPSLDS